MTEQQACYQRMVDWCAQNARRDHTHGLGFPPSIVVEGTRTITHQPLGAPGARERGTIDNEAFGDKEWLGDNPQQVIEVMGVDLGVIPEGNYRIRE